MSGLQTSDPPQPSSKDNAVVDKPVDMLEWIDNPDGIDRGPVAIKNAERIEKTIDQTKRRDETIKDLVGGIGVGHYKMNGALKKGLLSINVAYIYIPNDTLSRDDFTFHDAFKALGFQSPEQQMAFHCRGIFDYQQWNTRLPLRCPKKLAKNTQTQSKLFTINGVDLHDESFLRSGTVEHGPTEEEKAHQEIDLAHKGHKDFVSGCDLCDIRHRTNHHQELVKDCFKRLIKGASKACKVLNAVYLSDTNWSPERSTFLALCLNEAAKVPRLGLCETKDLNTDLVNELIFHMQKYNDKYDGTSEESKKCHLRFNSTWWQEAPAKDDNDEKVALAEIENSKPTSPQDDAHKAEWDTYYSKKDQHRKQSRIKKGPEGYVETIPDPGVTHLIITEDRALLEKKFDEQIRSAMLLINGGPYLCQQFMNFFHQQRPVFIFKYSGGAADAAAYTLEVTKGFHIFKTSSFNTATKLVRNDDNRPGFNRDEWCVYLHWLEKFKDHKTFLKHQNHLHPGELELYNRIVKVSKRFTNWLKEFQWYDKKLYEIFDGLIDNWPEQNDLENVVTIDLFTMSEESLQDQVVRAMNVQQGEKRRISYAWRLCHQFHYNAHLQHRYADFLMLSIILLTFLATAVSVIYAYFTSASVPPIPVVYQDALVKLNIILPVGVTVLRGVYAYLDPLVKYWSLKYAAIRTESEIYIYRAKVGQYAHKSGEVKKKENNGSRNSAAVASTTTQNDQNDQTSSSNEKHDRGSFKAVQESKKVKKAALTNDLPRKKFSETLNSILESVNERHTLLYPRMGCFSIDMHPMKDVTKRLSSHKTSQNFLTTQVEGPERLDMSSFWSKAWSNIKSLFQTKRVVADANYYVEDLEMVESRSADTVEDDGISYLTADNYVKLRLIPMIAEFTHDSPYKASVLNWTTSIVISLSVASSLFSTFDLVNFVPLALGFGSAIGQFISHKQFEVRLMQVNGSSHHLRKLLIWWNSLDVNERHSPKSIEYLVDVTESAVNAQVVGHVVSDKSSSAPGGKKKDGQSGRGDDDKEEERGETKPTTKR